MSVQLYGLSIIGFITSFIYGIGLLFAIPTLIQTINVKTNYVTYNKKYIEKAFFFTISSIVFSLISILLFFVLFPSLKN